MLVIQKNKEQSSAKQTTTPTEEYRTIPVSELHQGVVGWLQSNSNKLARDILGDRPAI